MILLWIGSPALAQDKTPEVDKIFSWASKETPGCVCMVSQNGKVVVNRAYGTADLGEGTPLETNAVFDIGSVRKQFIAAAALQLVQEKKLSLSEDIHAYLPELPKYGQKITLNHLLTHTSGIRDWTGLLPLATGDPETLTVILRQKGLNFKPGEEWSYSNSGYVLITEIIARTTKMPIAEFLRTRLFVPLGMTSTVYVTSMANPVQNQALGYEKTKDGWKLDMYLGNDRGGGAILSTAEDLIRWNDVLSSGKLGAFVSQKLQEPAQLNNGRKLGYGRGLFLETFRGVKEVWHSGGAAGYHTWLGRFPEQGVSVAVLCNSNARPASGLAERVVDLFVTYPETEKAVASAPPVLTGEALEQAKSRAGLYFPEKTGEPLRLAIDKDRFRVAGGPGLVPAGQNRYRRLGAFVQFMSQDAFELHFPLPDVVEVKSMEGKVSRYHRAQPYTPSTSELQALAGRYQNDEIGSVFHMTVGPDGNSLFGRANAAPAPGFEFKPVSKDTYQLGGVLLRFVRDKVGKVVALDYSNPVVRNLIYTRTSDQTSR
ncbi:serine hydrolase [Nibribacter ruber]|uniref:Serine hydrolase n=1 Tax=Nibribacter ruber TaxID=2698458 RepID=A0A6P1NZE1_9BACT|nr:serine hydrolase [Nibribacter ruber]QHL87629.1 serine hydrolase [Nibribacter ruber]